MNSPYSKLIDKRKDRVIAIILAFKDRELDQFLPDELSSRLRKIVLDQINDFCDFCVDIVGRTESNNIPNEHYFVRLEKKLEELFINNNNFDDR